MNFYNNSESVICEKCNTHPEQIIWDYDFDYDGNERVHEYGKYICICGDSRTFETNDPYEDEDE